MPAPPPPPPSSGAGPPPPSSAPPPPLKRRDSKQPIWREGYFFDEMLDAFASQPSNATAADQPLPSNATITSTLSAVEGLWSSLFAQADSSGYFEQFDVSERAKLAQVNKILKTAIRIGKDIPDCSENDEKFHYFLTTFLPRVVELEPGEIVLFPSGWNRSKNSNSNSHAVMILIQRELGHTFRLMICNTNINEGLDYHPTTAFFSPRLFRRHCMVFENIPIARFSSSSFWYFFFRQKVFTTDSNGPKQMYEVLFPFLVNKPLRTNMSEDSEWSASPVNGDTSYMRCVMNSLCYLLQRIGIKKDHIRYIGVMFRKEMLSMVTQDLKKAGVVSENDVLMINAACKELAATAGTFVQETSIHNLFTTTRLSLLQQELETIIKQSERLVRLPDTPFWSSSILRTECFPDKLEYIDNNQQTTTVKWSPLSLFSYFDRSEDIEKYAGEAPEPPLIRPVQLTLVPDKTENYAQIVDALRNCDLVCTLLSHQMNFMKNTAYLRVSLIQNLFTQVIPLPLPHNHPRKKDCLWSSPMLYAVQVEILRSLSLISRHFAACCMSIKVSRSFDSTRILTMACIAAVADQVIRTLACDIPSRFSVHISGTADGPSAPFGFDLGNFAVQSEGMEFISPELLIARTQVFDYFYQQKLIISNESHLIFRWERSMEIGNISRLLDQLCWEIGFDHSENILPLYLSGENPAMCEFFPEFAHFRDIVFLFKFMGRTLVEHLPEQKIWTQADARLLWKFKPKTGFVVTAFETQLDCVSLSFGEFTASELKEYEQKESSIFSSKKKWRFGYPSGADPGLLCHDPSVKSEIDILYVKDLPSFDKKLTQRESELLLSYLTVPYLRIPLVLAFFSAQEHITGLSSPKLREVMDAVLFEPGFWRATEHEVIPSRIPANRAFMSTALGLLFNELQVTSASATLRYVESLLDIALDMDCGRYAKNSSPTILYVVKTVVRIEGFMLTLIRHHRWKKKNIVSGCGYASYVRGLEIVESVYEKLVETQQRIRDVIDTQVFPMIERWCNLATAANSIDLACMLHAHLAYLYLNVETEDLNFHTVSVLLSSQTFLITRHTFDLDIKKDNEKKREDIDEELCLEISETELFDLFQKHRWKILNWLTTHPLEANEIMEAVVRVVTLTGTREKPKNLTTALSAREWSSMPGRHCVGRFIPDVRKIAPPSLTNVKQDPKEPYEKFIRRILLEQQAEAEVNVQLGVYKVRTSQLIVLNSSIVSMRDFREIIGVSRTKIQCAIVKQTIHRLWVRLVGLRYDLAYWLADRRVPPLPHPRRFSPSTAKDSESWIVAVVEHFRTKHLHRVDWFVPVNRIAPDALVAHLAGYDEDQHDKTTPGQGGPTLKELVIFREHHVVHVYNVIEHGRRFYRSLVYSSDPTFCLHDLELCSGSSSNSGRRGSSSGVSSSGSSEGEGTKVVEGGGVRGGVGDSVEGGNAEKQSVPEPSLVISRALNKEIGLQTYLPPRVFFGLLPTCLLEEYHFWQNEDDSITGIHVTKHTRLFNEVVIENPPPIRDTFLTVELMPLDKPLLSARVVRHNKITTAAIDNSGSSNSSEQHTLLNILEASHDSMLGRVRKWARRIENLSHCLVWTKDKITQISHACAVDLIEFPRLQLSFERVCDHTTGETRFYTKEYVGYFVSNHQCPSTSLLIQGLPHALMLETVTGDLALLVPAGTRPSRQPPAPGQLFSTGVFMDRHDEGWLQNMSVRHYLYPIHISRLFLFPPTFASSLYLLLLRFLHRQYDSVFRLAAVCATDISLSQEETQIFQQFTYLTSTYDAHPDAYGCRLKLSLVTAHSPLHCPWQIPIELEGYFKRYSSISAACRLTLSEESSLLALCGDAVERSIELLNRASYLRALLAGEGTSAPVALPFQVSMDSWDLVDDKTCLEDDLFKSPAKATYTRPEEKLCTGVAAMGQLSKFLETGFRLNGGKNNLGFLFFYELLTGSLEFRILPVDNVYEMGILLLRFLNASDAQTPSQLMSILRLLAYNPQVAAHPNIPTFKGNKNLTALFKGGSLSNLLKDLSKFFPTVEISWPVLVKLPVQETSVKVTIPVLPPLARLHNYTCKQRQLNTITNLKQKELCVLLEEDVRAFVTQPLSLLHLSSYIKEIFPSHFLQTEKELPFDVSRHFSARSFVSSEMLKRLKKDYNEYAKQHNEMKISELVNMEFEDNNSNSNTSLPSFLENSEKLKTQITHVQKILGELITLQQQDSSKVYASFTFLLRLVNGDMILDEDKEEDVTRMTRLAASLQRFSGRSTRIQPEYLIGCMLSPDAEAELKAINPQLSDSALQCVVDLLIASMFRANRVGQIVRCIDLARGLVKMLQSLVSVVSSSPSPASSASVTPAVLQGLKLQARLLASNLSMRRHYAVKENDTETKFVFDPRFLVFEFTYNLLLRQSQCELVNTFLDAYVTNTSLCHQMIMGQGKTTVVAPLLALALSTKNNLVMEVVPKALLDFSIITMRSRFTAIVQKPIYTFHYDRFTPLTPLFALRLLQAKEKQAIIISHPTAVKSIALKFLESLHMLDMLSKRKYEENKGIFGRLIDGVFGSEEKSKWEQTIFDERKFLLKQSSECVKILRIFKESSLILDEVDTLLHPLKSELNWPLGKKDPLDFSSSPAGNGLRWEIPFHILDAIFYATTHKLTVPYATSREALLVLEKIKKIVSEGLENKMLQQTPHLVLLNSSFYHLKLKPLLAHWYLVYLGSKQLTRVSESLLDSDLLRYLECGPIGDRQNAAKVQKLLRSEFIKMLNLGHDWLQYFMPFVLQKIDRVSFGLLSAQDLARALEENARLPKSRKLLAVPFVGKDVPSQSSEFSHPDVTIGLTILAYRYEGLRRTDFRMLLDSLLLNMSEENGPYHRRPSCQLFARWVYLAGGEVRGWKRKLAEDAKNLCLIDMPETQIPSKLSSPHLSPLSITPTATTTATTATTTATATATATTTTTEKAPDIWPLQLIQLADEEQFSLVYELLRGLPHMIEFLLNEHIFPDVMKHQGLKLSASGQALGGALLFNQRMGFSGTPSELMPIELGKCYYEKGSDGKVLHTLTDSKVVTYEVMEKEWSVRGLLDCVIHSNITFHCLIDTGALITGMSNEEVARYLLTHGLNFECVVFLDSLDRKVVLIKQTMRVILLSQCGIPQSKRFIFFDQIHTTGMDIPQMASAKAVVTIGKDMTFRDYAQGSYRMRGIGAGQTIHLFIIPEVRQLIRTQLGLVEKGGGESKKAPGPPPSPTPSERKVPPPPSPSTTSVKNSGNNSSSSNSNSEEDAQMLVHVVALMVINGMASERIQFNMLCEQNVHNVWEKRIFKELIENYQMIGTNTCSKRIQEGLEVTRLRVDFTVENNVPTFNSMIENLQKDIDANINFLQDETDQKVVGDIRRLMITTEREAQEANAHGVDDSGVPQIAFQSEQVQEQEQEQEQQQQQEQEEEEEDEEEDLVVEEVIKKKYIRGQEEPKFWEFDDLCEFSRLTTKDHNNNTFFPASEFGLPTGVKNEAPLRNKFPEYVMLSQNFHKSAWETGGFRRLKNVIIVMEWVPDPSLLKVQVKPKGGQMMMTVEQEQRLLRAFRLFKVVSGDSGPMQKNEVRELLQAADCCAKDREDMETLLALVSGQQGDFTMDTSQLTHMMQNKTFARVETGRYYVALSLEEAETVRALAHQRKDNNFGQFSFCLRLNGIDILDSFPHFSPPRLYQQLTAELCLRYLNSDSFFNETSINLLLRSIQENSCVKRQDFFKEALSCRRRLQGSLESTPVWRALCVEDEYYMLEYRASIVKLRAVIRGRGMLLLDAFRAFDYDRDGMLSCAELYGGLTWLGMELKPVDVLGLMRNIAIITTTTASKIAGAYAIPDSKLHHYKINFRQFAIAFRDPLENLYTSSSDQLVAIESSSSLAGEGDDFKRIHVPPRPLFEEEEKLPSKDAAKLILKDTDAIPTSVLEKVRIRVHKVSRFAEVWSTKTLNTRSHASVWSPSSEVTRSVLSDKKQLELCLGFYGTPGFNLPSKSKIDRLTLEISFKGRSGDFQRIISDLFPHPVKFNQVWKQEQGGFGFWAWEGVPPDSMFACLGAIGTATGEEPNVNMVRCVPKKWLVPSQVTPTRFWDDSGTGGQMGSFWTMSSNGLLTAIPGHGRPQGIFYDFWKKEWNASEGLF